MKKLYLIIFLSLFYSQEDFYEFIIAPEEPEFGVMNNSGIIDIIDIVLVVNEILENN